MSAETNCTTGLESLFTLSATQLSMALTQAMAQHNLIATGATLAGLQVTASPTGFAITDTNQTLTYATQGRGAGASPPIAAIQKWIAARGLPINPKNPKGLAFAIAKTIAKKGTLRHRLNKPIDIVAQVLTPEYIDNLKAAIANHIISNINLTP